MADRAPITLKDIATAVEGTLFGNGDAVIARPADPAAAGPDDLALAFEPDALALLPNSRALAALVATGAVVPQQIRGYVMVERPRHALAALTRMFDRPRLPAPGVHPTAVVEPGVALGPGVAVGALAWIGAGARLGARCTIMPQATIGPDVSLGDDCTIHSGARIGAGVKLGQRVIVHPNAVIGADGFSYATRDRRSVDADQIPAAAAKIHSLGTVDIADDVEIGAGSTIDRATIAVTRVGRGTKIDNQVMVGHNTAIGEDCLIVAQVGISGSVAIGNRVLLAGQAGIADHRHIGDDATVMAASGVGGDVRAGAVVGGFPAIPRSRLLQQMLNIGRLSRLIATVADLKKRLQLVETHLPAAGGRVRKEMAEAMSETAESVRDIIARHGHVARELLLPEAKLNDLHVTSLNVVEILFALEDKFKIEIPIDANQQQTLQTVSDVIALVEGQVNAKRPGV